MKKGEVMKRIVKILIINLYCLGLLSLRATQRIYNKLNLKAE